MNSLYAVVLLSSITLRIYDCDTAVRTGSKGKLLVLCTSIPGTAVLYVLSTPGFVSYTPGIVSCSFTYCTVLCIHVSFPSLIATQLCVVL